MSRKRLRSRATTSAPARAADGRVDAAGFVAFGGDVAGVVAHLDRLGAGLEGRGAPAWPPRRDWCWRPARGLRSQPKFGLTQTTSPRLTKRFRPPSSAMAFSVSFSAICFMSASAGLAPVQRAMVMSTGLAAAASSAKRPCGPSANMPPAAAELTRNSLRLCLCIKRLPCVEEKRLSSYDSRFWGARASFPGNPRSASGGPGTFRTLLPWVELRHCGRVKGRNCGAACCARCTASSAF